MGAVRIVKHIEDNYSPSLYIGEIHSNNCTYYLNNCINFIYNKSDII